MFSPLTELVIPQATLVVRRQRSAAYLRNRELSMFRQKFVRSKNAVYRLYCKVQRCCVDEYMLGLSAVA